MSVEISQETAQELLRALEELLAKCDDLQNASLFMSGKELVAEIRSNTNARHQAALSIAKAKGEL